MKKIYHADFHIPKWSDLDVKQLKDRDIKGVILDVDGTIVHNGKLVPGTQAMLEKLEQNGIAVAILTNNILIKKELLTILQLDRKYIKTFALKPFPQGYRYIEENLGYPPDKLAMITNNSLLDILGANLRGMYTVKVLEHETFLEKKVRGFHASLRRNFTSKKQEKDRAKIFRKKQKQNGVEEKKENGKIREILKEEVEKVEEQEKT